MQKEEHLERLNLTCDRGKLLLLSLDSRQTLQPCNLSEYAFFIKLNEQSRPIRILSYPAFPEDKTSILSWLSCS